MTYEEFISKYNDRWSGTVDDFKKLGIGNADENGIDWLLKYQDAEDEGDVDKMMKLFPLAPLTLRQHAKFQKHANGFFDQFIKPNYADPKKQNQAYTAFINNTGFSDSATADAAVTAKEKSGNPVLPMSDSEVKVAAAKKAAQAKPVGPADVKANAAIPPPQKSIAEQQADYIRSRGGRTAADADKEFESNLRKDYSEATGFDIDTAEGRRKSFSAALQRGGHADAMARNLRAGKYAYLDPNSDAGMKASDAAYQKHFKGKDWVGDNPLTGEMKDVDGNIWDSQDAYNQSGMNPNAPKVEPSGEILTPEQATASRMRSMTTRLEGEYDPEMMQYSFIRDQLNPTGRSMRRFHETEAQDYANQQIADSLRISNAPVQGPDMKGYHQRSDAFIRARVAANAQNDFSLDGLSSGEYFDPNFLHRTKGNAVNDLGVDPSAGHAPDPYNNITLPSNGFGVRGHLPLGIPNMKLPPMPQGSAEDAAEERLGLQGFRNAMGPAARPENQVAQSGGRPLGPMNLNRPSIKPIVPIRSYPKFR
jgi:hypothetical protein